MLLVSTFAQRIPLILLQTSPPVQMDTSPVPDQNVTSFQLWFVYKSDCRHIRVLNLSGTNQSMDKNTNVSHPLTNQKVSPCAVFACTVWSVLHFFPSKLSAFKFQVLQGSEWSLCGCFVLTAVHLPAQTQMLFHPSKLFLGSNTDFFSFYFLQRLYFFPPLAVYLCVAHLWKTLLQSLAESAHSLKSQGDWPAHPFYQKCTEKMFHKYGIEGRKWHFFFQWEN